ncbi:MAG TPA: tetratricopeptide repeat protein, partial [Candidatus Kapabacteria bacterium]|nr:tetratricopeptide repeat protein [Candidatus Kapabacteria bacterium]
LIHAEKCEEWETACNIALNAAKDAWRSYASEETSEMLEKCLADVAHINRNAALLKINSLLLRAELEKHQARYETTLKTLKEIHVLCAEIQDAEHDAKASLDESVTYSHLGQYHDAQNILEIVLQNARTNNDLKTEASALRLMGANYYRFGEYHRALECHFAANEITKKIDGKEKPTDSGHIGETYRMLGEYDKALEYATRALELARQSDDRVEMCYQFGNTGLVYYALGKYMPMKEYLEQGLAIAEAIGNRSEQTAMLGRIGLAYHAMGDCTTALKYFEQSLTLAKATSDKLREAEQTNNIGAIYSELGDRPRALEYLKHSLTIKEEIGSRAGQASTLINIGDNLTLAGEYKNALEYYNRSLEIANATGNHNFRIIGYTNGASAYRLAGELGHAREWLEKANAVLQENDDPSTRAEFLREFGMFEEAEALTKNNNERTEHIRLAQKYIKQAEQIFREIKHQPKADKCAAELARMKKSYAF